MDFAQLITNPYIVGCVMALIIFAVTQLLKLPIKAVTKKIKNERLRRIANSVILLIPFALGVLLEFLYNTYVIFTDFTVITGLGYGAAGVSLYGVIERFFKVKVENPYDTEEGKAVCELIENVTEDNKVDEKDIDAVKVFWDKIKK